MKRGALAAMTALAIAAIVAGVWVSRSRTAARRPGSAPEPPSSRVTADAAVLLRLRGIPLYRELADSGTVQAGSIDPDGTLHVEIDVQGFLGPRLAAWGWGDAVGSLPKRARGTIVFASAAGVAPAVLARESWSIPGRAPILDLLDRSPAEGGAGPAADALPGTPSAIVHARLVPSRLVDPSFGGDALAAWRDRAAIVETLLGRPIRSEVAEDLAGPAVFALYEPAGGAETEALAAFELRRSDRLAELLETLFGLGALTERANVRRYRGVATGSFLEGRGGPGLAVAVDGSLLLVASSRARLESAIDARRALVTGNRALTGVDETAAGWSSIAKSAFVAHGWARLARIADAGWTETATISASLRPEGADGWRLEGRGAAPAITADPIVPYLRSVWAKRQREGG